MLGLRASRPVAVSAAGVDGRGRAPLVIVAGTQQTMRAAARGLERAGWVLREGLSPASYAGNGARPSIVVSGYVRDEADARAALLAATAGAGLLLSLQVQASVRERFYEDLRHVGDVEHRTPHRSDALIDLEEVDRRLLDMLAGGRSLEDVAARLHYSRRTVHRRVQRIRRALGVGTTAEALVLLRDAAEASGTAPTAEGRPALTSGRSSNSPGSRRGARASSAQSPSAPT